MSTLEVLKGGDFKMKALHMAAFVFLLLGGLNVGLSTLGIGVIGSIFDSIGLGQIFAILVGISAVYIATTHMSDCKMCSK